MNLRHDWSASLIDWDRTRNGRSPDERSLRRCNSLKSDGAVQRRVRQKSLYLRDSSDMNRSVSSLSSTFSMNGRSPLRMIRADRAGLHHWLLLRTARAVGLVNEIFPLPLASDKNRW